MNNKQETNTTDVEKAFEEQCDRVEKTLSPNSLKGLIAINILEANKDAFKAFFTAGARSRDEEIEQLRKDLKWALYTYDQRYLGDEEKRKEIIKRHGLDKPSDMVSKEGGR